MGFKFLTSNKMTIFAGVFCKTMSILYELRLHCATTPGTIFHLRFVWIMGLFQ